MRETRLGSWWTRQGGVLHVMESIFGRHRVLVPSPSFPLQGPQQYSSILDLFHTQILESVLKVGLLDGLSNTAKQGISFSTSILIRALCHS